jgi:hypothetical protein
MSLRGFFIWFWGIVFGSGVAAGAALAVLKAPAGPPATPAARPVPQAANALPLPLPPPLPALTEAPARQAETGSWRPAHPTVIHPALRPREPHRLAERITVVPPIPPDPAETRAAPERRVRTAHYAAPRRSYRVETRVRMAPSSPEPRLYSYYPRYSYDSYSYTFPYQGYPPRFSYFYRY